MGAVGKLWRIDEGRRDGAGLPVRLGRAVTNGHGAIAQSVRAADS